MTGGTGRNARHRHPRWSAGSGAETPSILADALRTLDCVHGVVRLPAWDLAVECVDEALASGAVPSLERLGRLGQLGSLPSFIAALGEADDAAELATDFARERESMGLAPEEVASELLVLGRVLERHGEAAARAAVDRCLVDYVGRVTGELADCARRDALTGLLNHRAFHAQLAVRSRPGPTLPRPRRARPLRPRPLQGDERPRGPSGGRPPPPCVRRRPDRDAARDGRRGPPRWRRVRGAAPRRGPARRRRLRHEAAGPHPRGHLGQRRLRPPPRGVLSGGAARADRRPPPLLGQVGQGRLGPVQGLTPDMSRRRGPSGRGRPPARTAKP